MVSHLHSLLFQFKHRFLLASEGQDLIEYALLAALVSLGAVAGMQSVATDVSSAYTHIATTFSARV